MIWNYVINKEIKMYKDLIEYIDFFSTPNQELLINMTEKELILVMILVNILR